jgi:nucleotide-binding universal stress UspA family protein
MGRAMFQVQRVLYATDFSSYSNQAYFHAVALAEHHGAELIICHCVGQNETNPEYWNEQLRQIRPSNRTIAVSHQLLQGEAAEEIVDFARAQKVNMIVMGTHGLTNIDRTLMGGTAERVLREAPCSVLVIKLPNQVSSAAKREAVAL